MMTSERAAANEFKTDSLATLGNRFRAANFAEPCNFPRLRPYRLKVKVQKSPVNPLPIP